MALDVPALECEKQLVLEKGGFPICYKACQCMSIFLTQKVLSMENHENIHIILTHFSPYVSEIACIKPFYRVMYIIL